MDHLSISALSDLLATVLCGCVLPIYAIWQVVRRHMNDTDRRTQIVLAAIEKNPDMDIEELIKKISPKKKLLKEKLLAKLLWGSLTALLGLGLIGFGAWLICARQGGQNDPLASIIFGLILLAIGIAFLVNYFLGKKMLAKEIEAEEKILTAQAESK